MQSNRERVEALGIGAAQEFLFVGRDTFRAVSNLLADEIDAEPFEDAIHRIRETIRQFRKTMESVRQDLPLAEASRHSIRELPWEDVTNRGVDEGHVAGPDDEVWRCVVSSVVRGDPLAPVEMIVSQLSRMKHCLESVLDSLEGGTLVSTWRTIWRAIRAYLLAVRIGVNASYANAVVGRKLGAATVPEAAG